MNTNYSVKRKELRAIEPYYSLIDDCLKGDAGIKEKTIEYLPVPSPESNDETSQRYLDYIKRAVFYNVTGRTLSGITGLVYLKDAGYNLPDLLEPLKTDCTGEGISLAQLSKRALRWGMSFGRAGLFVDYPQLDSPVTRDQITSGDIQPIFRLFRGDQIWNWRTKVKNGKQVLSLVVCVTKEMVELDEFVSEEYDKYWILRLGDDDVFTVETVSGKDYSSNGVRTPVDSKGKPFDSIPFFFVGSENNDSDVDHPPIYDLAILNIAHYRNSADYEEACYTVGQPTVWASGLTEEWATDVLGGKIVIGSRGLLPLPENGQAGILQVSENTMAMEAMKHKEDQMLALGAKLVQSNSGNRTTATEATINDASETSILVNVSKNVSDAFTTALIFACRYVGAVTDSVEFVLQADLELTKMDSQELMALVASWQDGAISRTELRYNLRKSGIAHGNEDAMIAEIEKEQTERQKNLKVETNKQTGVNNANKA